jgi:hypothetical protein
VQGGARLTHFAAQASDLEEVFLRVTERASHSEAA